MIEIVPRAPKDETTGSVAMKLPVKVIFGLVADSVPAAGCTVIVVLVPTKAERVAQVSVAAKLA